MLRFVDYKCEECGTLHIDMPLKDCDIPSRMDCPICDRAGVCRRVYSMPAVIFAENNGHESSKGDHYWANAEWNRIKEQNKRKDAKKEKIFYQDKETEEKFENKRDNLLKQGDEKVEEVRHLEEVHVKKKVDLI